MDRVYHIISGVINIDLQRKEYTRLYDHVRDIFLNGLKKDVFFKQLFSETKLCGSYADNLKISAPDEFDLVMRLMLPEFNKVEIIEDASVKGNIKINLVDVLEHLKSNSKTIMYNFLNGCTNEEGFLLENKIQEWLQSCFSKIIKDIKYKIDLNEEQYKLHYKKGGPAHTITVQNIKSDKPTLSIDFVPAFVFPPHMSLSLRFPTDCWEAIPRPMKVFGSKDNASFRTSYTESERKILSGKGQLKNALRLVKKFRDRNCNMTPLKSFYIKTLFLWIDEESGSKFWKLPLRKIMEEVLLKLDEALRNKEIKFFWHTEVNLLKDVRETQIYTMRTKVQAARKTLKYPSYRNRIVNLFLTDEEIQNLPEETRLSADSVKGETENKYLLYSIICLYGVVLSYQIYRVITQRPDLSL